MPNIRNATPPFPPPSVLILCTLGRGFQVPVRYVVGICLSLYLALFLSFRPPVSFFSYTKFLVYRCVRCIYSVVCFVFLIPCSHGSPSVRLSIHLPINSFSPLSLNLLFCLASEHVRILIYTFDLLLRNR
jgi:hypothetical protein